MSSATSFSPWLKGATIGEVRAPALSGGVSLAIGRTTTTTAWIIASASSSVAATVAKCCSQLGGAAS
eukprot:5474888-Pyramimonas_sp.AAC.1